MLPPHCDDSQEGLPASQRGRAAAVVGYFTGVLNLPAGAGQMAAGRVRLLCWAADRPRWVPPQRHGRSRTTDPLHHQL